MVKKIPNLTENNANFPKPEVTATILTMMGKTL